MCLFQCHTLKKVTAEHEDLKANYHFLLFQERNWDSLGGCFQGTQWPLVGPGHRYIHLFWHLACKLQRDPEYQFCFCPWQGANYKVPLGQMPYGTGRRVREHEANGYCWYQSQSQDENMMMLRKMSMLTLAFSTALTYFPTLFSSKKN